LKTRNCSIEQVKTTAAPLDPFLPRPDVRERFEIIVRAPADLVMQVATGFDMQSITAVRAIFRLRERLMGAPRVAPRPPRGLLDDMKSLGWGVLAEQPGRHVVCGARCQPWLADVKFTALDPAEFASYAQPNQVKIAWTLEAEALGPALTRFAQETRAAATDEHARRSFRRYWRWARFGIIAIRLLMLPALRRTAERRWSQRQSNQG
jgi:hypothetical protein